MSLQVAPSSSERWNVHVIPSSHDVVIAGGTRHGVRAGQFVDAGGDGHNRLILSAMHFMGATDVTAFGATDQGRGPFTLVYG